MFRFRPPFVSPTPTPEQLRHCVTYEPLAYVSTSPLPAAEGAIRVHVDYDRHPLGVHEFEHYIAGPECGERFHVR